ncbi:ARPP-2 domain-containing protein [Myxococcus stipitatus]|uniref:ARPP-2 domain-containing protein n=1 Tax=Myxococcus stipitatus TaxID=83455 RepID=UPI0030CC65BB
MSRARLIQRLELQGLRLAPSQVWGQVRLVPVLRDEVRGDLRFAHRNYGDAVSVVSVQGAPAARGLKYVSYIPHGLVMTWGNRQAEAVYGTRLQAQDGKKVDAGAFSVRLLHRMVHREDRNQLRMLPLHLAMEGFLARYFGGPDIAWSEYSRDGLSRGLNPRSEASIPGWASFALDGALRTFELHERQVGLLLFNADELLSAFIVAHPDDYRALHRTLLEDFYGDLLLQYGYLQVVGELGLRLDASRVSSVADLREQVARMREDWATFHGFMAGGLFGVEVTARKAYEAGPFLLQHFHTRLIPSEENHLGEAIIGPDGTLEYLKTYRLSAAQTRRAYLLQQLAGSQWNLDDAAKALGSTRTDLVVRLHNAGFGYLLKPHVLEEAQRSNAWGR